MAADRTPSAARAFGFEVGRGWHKLRFSTGVRRWPTCRGENPPQGIPYRNVEASYGSRCVQVRLWNWRKHGR